MAGILIVDDHSVVRKGLLQILSDMPKVGPVDDVASGEEALSLLSRKNYDLVLLDLALKDENGFHVLSQIKKKAPRLPVLILSMYGEENYGVRARLAGASGYITKDETPEKLLSAVSSILSGRTYFSQAVEDGTIGCSRATEERAPHLRLSSREFEIMCLLARGVRVKEIADRLYISIKTVSTHRRNILEKMNMQNNAELADYALFEGLIR